MKVGNYIHFRYENYLRRGLNIYKETSPAPWAVLANQKKKLLNDVLASRADGQKSTIKTSLENQLNFFFNPQAVGSIQFGYTPQEAQALQQKIISLCEEALGKLSGADINWSTLQATGVNNIGIGNGALYEEFRKIRETRIGREGQSTTTTVAISRRLKALMDLRDSLGEDLEDGSVDQQFVNKLNKFQKKYQSIVDSLVQVQNGTNTQTNLGLRAKKISVTNNANFIKELQDLIDDTKKMTIQQINGLLGEYIPVLTQAVLSNVAEKGLEDTLANMSFSQELLIPVFGGQRSHKGLVSTNVITQKAVRGSSNLSLEATLSDIKTKVGTTFDKVDIQLQVPDQSTPINASVKNIKNKKSRISILDGTSSLEILQSYPEFANHYLNITALHPDGSAGKYLLQGAHDVMKLTIALHALAGGNWGKESGSDIFKQNAMAEILVVNQQGKFKVYFMSDIIKKVASNLDFIDIAKFNAVHRWDNDYIGTTPSVKAAYRRITNVLIQLHTQKLKVSLKPSVLS